MSMARLKGSKNKPKGEISEKTVNVDDDGNVKSFNTADFVRDIAEVVRQKASAAEYGGMAGQATKQCADRSGLHRKAIGLCAALAAMDPAKRTSLVTDLMVGLEAMGFLDEGDFFSTPRKSVEAAIAARSGASGDDERDLRPAFLRDKVGAVEDQVAENIERLQSGIKPLAAGEPPAPPAESSSAGDAPGSYSLN